VQQQTSSTGSVRLAIQLLADTSRTLAAAAQEVAASAAAEATVAADLASRGWDQGRRS
jgi:methyl-accepting chemotaxis protein